MYSAASFASDFIHCHYKSELKLAGSAGEVSHYETLCRDLDSEYQQAAIQHLLSQFHSRTVLRGGSLDDIKRGKFQLFLDVDIETEIGPLRLDAVELTPNPSNGSQHLIVPQCFCRQATVSSHDRLMAAVISAIMTDFSIPVEWVKLIYGPTFSTRKLVLVKNGRPTRIYAEAQSIIAELKKMHMAEGNTTKCILNNHCRVCEFQNQCRLDAEQRDDISLLSGLTPGEIKVLNERGIFTVTQLAYTFRAKSVGRNKRQPKRHSQPLQAMAIRDKTVFIRTNPELPTSNIIYLDIEGVPEKNSYYLIGLIAVDDNGKSTVSQFWADSASEEQKIWTLLLQRLEELRPYDVLHFGAYEREYVECMIERYGSFGEIHAGGILNRFHDVYQSIRTNVFFPVYSNSLKSIAGFLGATWEGEIKSGLDSLVWRWRWERQNSTEAKEELLRYNISDCQALRIIAEFLSEASLQSNEKEVSIQMADGIRNPALNQFGNTEFALPEIQQITKCAYFSYQHDKIFFRTDKNIRKSVRRKRRAMKAKIQVNSRVACMAPLHCPKCAAERIHGFQQRNQKKVIRDLKLTQNGIKRWVVEYSTDRYQCKSCQHTCYSPEYPTKAPYYGHGVASWAVYQHVALRQSYESAVDNINDLFGFSFNNKHIHRARGLLAEKYRQTEVSVLEQLIKGGMICADEAKIQYRGGTGYVWAFSNAEEVVYRFSVSREGSLLDEVLNDYSGVLVSDFYGAYDSVKCEQQKCLIHLIREINDDLLKAPFDADLKAIAERFTALLKPIIDAIDKFGLRARYLRKFIPKSESYRKWMARQQFQSQAALKYQKRINKYGDRLFTFLSHDGVPWNNNLAENAVKLIVSRRRIIGASFSEGGIKEYLLFLSIFQTLRRKGGSFLRFLFSQKSDIFEYLETGGK